MLSPRPVKPETTNQLCWDCLFTFIQLFHLFLSLLIFLLIAVATYLHLWSYKLGDVLLCPSIGDNHVQYRYCVCAVSNIVWSLYGVLVSGSYLPQYTPTDLSKRKTSADLLLYYL